MDKVFNKLLLIDGSFMIHRALHIPEFFDMISPLGVRNGGIYGFLKILGSELKISGNYFPIVVFDDGLNPRRTEIYPDYKKRKSKKNESVMTKEESDDEYIEQYHVQRNQVAIILSYLGIPVIRFKDNEGDDLLAILSRLAKESIVLTDDKDMLQLLSENCKVRRPMANELWDYDAFVKDKEFSDIYDFIIYKAVMGDSSDNIPKSCNGVGDKSINYFIKLIYI